MTTTFDATGMSGSRTPDLHRRRDHEHDEHADDDDEVALALLPVVGRPDHGRRQGCPPSLPRSASGVVVLIAPAEG